MNESIASAEMAQLAVKEEYEEGAQTLPCNL